MSAPTCWEEVEPGEDDNESQSDEDDSADDPDTDETSVTRRAAGGLLGVGILGGGGLYLSQGVTPTSEQAPTESTTPAKIPTETPTGGYATQQARLAPDDGDSYDTFGVSVTMSSDSSTALIGENWGSAYVFE